MAHMSKLILVFTCILLSSCCQHKMTLKESDRTEIEQIINEKFSELTNAAEAADVEKIFSIILENNDGALIRDGELLVTRQEALEAYKNGFQRVQGIKYEIRQKHVHVISPEVALLVSEGTSIATLNDGRTFNTPMAQTIVFVLKDGDWKVLHIHSSVPRK